MLDALITNGQVIDGSGSPRFFAAVAVSGDTVTIHRDGEVPYRLIAQTMSPSGREFYPLTRSEHLDVLAFRPYTSQPNIGNVLASCISMWNLLERSTLRPLSMSSVATLIFSFIAHLSPAEIAPLTTLTETPMTTTASDPQIVPRQPAALPALLAADQGVASALAAVLSDNTRRVYGAQWRLFHEWCDSVSLPSLPAAAPHRRPLPGGPRR